MTTVAGRLSVVALAIAGCAPTLTAKQERIYVAFEECKQQTGAIGYQLERTTDDGHFKIRGPADRSATLQECMRRENADLVLSLRRR